MPAYYPVYLDLRGRKCVVIGGGFIGQEKVERLIEFGADVVIYAQEATSKVRELSTAGDLTWVSRGYLQGDLEGAFIAIVADTSDNNINQAVAKEAKERNVPLNVNDVTDLCTWIAPAEVKNGDVVISASTGGTSPALARKLREELAGTSRTGSKYRPIEYGDLAPLLKEIRSDFLKKGIRLNPDHWQASITDDVLEMLKAGKIDDARKKLLSTLNIGLDCDCPKGVCDLWDTLLSDR